MSIFTKIFVVLVMVLSVLLVAMIVPFVINTNTYKADYEDERARRIVYQANAAEREAEVVSQIQAKNQQVDNLNAQIAQLQDQLNNRDTMLQEQQAQLVALRNANDDVRSELSRLSSSLDQASQINASLQEEVRNRRENMVTLNTRAVELTDELRARTTEVDTLERQVRLLQEQNADLTQQNEEILAQLQSGGGGMQTAQNGLNGAQAFESNVAIRGRVTRVQDIGEDTFVSLNVGSSDNVSEGMRFLIHQDGQFLGNVIVNRVDENSSAGRVTLQRGEITANAQVQSGGGS